MARRRTPPAGIESREDATSIIVGGEGNPFGQAESDQLITRVGVRAEDADYDIDADLVNGDVVIGPIDIGGTREVAGGFESETPANFAIDIEWLADDNSVLFTETLSGAQSYTITSITLKSENVRVTVRDTAGGTENNVTGTLNFH